MSATIKRYELTWLDYDICEMKEESDGDYVLHADHLSSHAYDEAKERALFEATFSYSPLIGRKKDGDYRYPSVQCEWEGWIKCAKSRAKAPGFD
jgi:hypothetical protein